MSSNDDQNSGSNVIDFGRRTGLTGFNLTPIPPSGAGAPLGPVIPPQPATPPTNGTGERTRRSPLDMLAALPSPTLTAPPVVATPHPDGGLPDTFRGPNAGDPVGPRMGALSMAAILAVAVAALRGSATVVEDWRQRRMTREAENAPLRKARIKAQAERERANSSSNGSGSGSGSGSGGGKGGSGSGGKSKRVPSSHDFGRKTLGNRSGSGGKGPGGGTNSKSKGAGLGPGRGKSNNTGTGPGSKASRGGGLLGGGGRGKGNGSKTKDRSGTGGGSSSSKRQKSPGRGSQGAGSTLKKHKKSNGNSGATGSGGGSRTKNTPSPKKQPKGRTTLRQAAAKQLGNAAQNRLHKRRKNLNNPAVWSGKDTPGNTKTKNKKTPNTNSPGQPGAQTTTKPKKPTTKTPSGAKKRRAGRTTLAGAMGHTAYQAAKARLKKRRHAGATPPVWGATRTSRTRAQRTANRKKRAQQAAAWTAKAWTKARAKARQKATNSGCFTGTGSGTAGGTQHAGAGSHGQQGAGQAGPGQQSQRRSPFGNAAASGPTTWTVERDDQPSPTPETGPIAGIGRGTDALPAAPEPHAERPGTTRPQQAHPMPPATAPQPVRKEHPRMSNRPTGAPGLDPEHATEITLDDALDELGDLKDDAFKTHSRCNILAARARKLRDTLEQLAIELKTKHNVWGRLFGPAMYRLMESMELLASMADEMEDSSLEAAEMAEIADNELNDAYRPISQATADAGLTTPSAPIHNRA